LHGRSGASTALFESALIVVGGFDVFLTLFRGRVLSGELSLGSMPVLQLPSLGTPLLFPDFVCASTNTFVFVHCNHSALAPRCDSLTKKHLACHESDRGFFARQAQLATLRVHRK